MKLCSQSELGHITFKSNVSVTAEKLHPFAFWNMIKLPGNSQALSLGEPKALQQTKSSSTKFQGKVLQFLKY